MDLPTKKELSLISQVEKSGTLAGRFNNVACINIDENGKKKGCFSLVFSADDIAQGEKVILKFLSPEVMTDKYRVDSFSRESDILKRLHRKGRCLNFVHGPDTFKWQIPMDSASADFDVEYFAVEYLPIDVEPYFINQVAFSALDKLQLFWNTVLAVAAIHDGGVFHRDMKSDNFRAISVGGRQIVKIIDFGTAAHYLSPLVTSDLNYPDNPNGRSVGAPAFSAPEHIVGLASHREIGKSTDIYALGALLYQLFNLQLFAKSRSTPDFDQVISYLHMCMTGSNRIEDRVNIWDRELPKFKHVLDPPALNSRGHNLPPAINSLLTDLHLKMTRFDYKDRLSDLQIVLKRVDSAIRILSNIALERKKIEARKRKRELKLLKLRQKQERLDHYLKQRRKLQYNVEE